MREIFSWCAQAWQALPILIGLSFQGVFVRWEDSVIEKEIVQIFHATTRYFVDWCYPFFLWKRRSELILLNTGFQFPMVGVEMQDSSLLWKQKFIEHKILSLHKQILCSGGRLQKCLTIRFDTNEIGKDIVEERSCLYQS